MSEASLVIATARREIGYLEKASNRNLDDGLANVGSGNYTKYARDLDKVHFYNGPKNGFPWCDVFFDWCVVETLGLDRALELLGQPMRSSGASCTASANYYKQAGRFITGTPAPGDQIFFLNRDGTYMSHTGIVERVSGGRVYTIEGNTSGEPGVVPNGGAVAAKSYALNYHRIAGYGRPKYKESGDKVDQKQFDQMMEDWLERQKQQPPAAWSSEARAWAEENGILAGNASGQKMYRSPCTREQMVVFLHRLWKMLTERR